jgi:hypothetical protein
MYEPSIECEDCGGIDPGSLYEPEPCDPCGGTGRELIEPGDRIRYRDDETGAVIDATVLNQVNERGWLEVRDEPGRIASRAIRPGSRPRSLWRNSRLRPNRSRSRPGRSGSKSAW